MKEIWKTCLSSYKNKWKSLWEQYRTLVIPFIVGSSKYLRQLIYGFLFLIGSFVYESGKYSVNKLITWLKKI